MDDDCISEGEFWENWGVIQKDSGDLFEYNDIKDHPIQHVWTILETGDGENENWYASPGIHYVNRLGYVLTSKPWQDYCRDAIYFLNNFESDEEGGDDGC